MTPEQDGPVAQSIGIGFKALAAATAALGLAWAVSNWRQVPADSQAVVLRFGRIAAVQQAGLTVSWPRPVGQVVLAPGIERLLTLRTAATSRPGGLVDVFTQANGAGLPDGADSYLTGDGGAVLLAATVTYQVTDGAAYALAQLVRGGHVPPALQRLFAASAVRVVAARRLDDVLVARPDGAEGNPAQAAAAQDRRQALRSELTREMNRRLAELAAAGAPLGVAVTRIDLEASLPPAAKIAFDGVLVAVQLAEQGIAGARTEATRIGQAADRERDLTLVASHAAAAERVGQARVATAAAVALQASMTAATRPAVLDQLYRDQVALLLHKAGRVTAVDPAGGQVMLPATPPLPGGAP